MKECTSHYGTLMVFHSFAYLLFFPIVYLVYFLLPGRVRYLWLLAASCFFYACADGRYLLLLGAVTLIAYGSGLLITRAKACGRSGAAKSLLVFTVLCDLGILGYCKYTNFLLENLNNILKTLHQDRQFSPISGLLTLGISFLLFQSFSYTVDVYRDTITAERNLLKFALYLAFFPKLISGPIERAGDILPQIHAGTRFSLQNLKEGLCLILLGFSISWCSPTTLPPSSTLFFLPIWNIPACRSHLPSCCLLFRFTEISAAILISP